MRGFGRGFAAAIIVVLLIFVGYLVFSNRASSSPQTSNGLTDCGNGVFAQPGASCPGVSTNTNNTNGITGITPLVTTVPVATSVPVGTANTPAPSGGGPTNGGGQDFPGTVTGPAIVEWYGDASCGTFKLPSGETFSWNRVSGGHYWTYASDSDVNAAWSAHVTAFNAKPFNQQHACQVDVRP